MQITLEKIIEALSFVIEPDLKKDIVALNLVSNIEVKNGVISFDLKISNPAMHNRKRLEEACEHQLKRFLGADVKFEANITAMGKAHERAPEHRSILPNVQHIIAVASGKGGVGKSTVASNLAVGLAMQGFKVGMVDADIYGPSVPAMFDVAMEKPTTIDVDGKEFIKPIESHGVKMLSIGFFSAPDQAVVWRGPMATKALTQLFKDAHWGALDFMIIDLPPGTGDVHLTMVQQVPLTGAVVVSTPQEIALVDVRKALGMFSLPEINVPVLGLVENMAYFSPPELPEKKYYIFGEGGAKELAERMNINYLAEIPIVQSIREAGDAGRPAVLQRTTPQAIAFMDLARKVAEKVGLTAPKAI
ncbi:MAG: ATP-binding protein involved in chromosome partitioning [Vicingaceae bacterium]|jgi:ATP-binding protein involved in chromosome partitioning